MTGHEHDHPHSHLNAIEMAFIAATANLCPHCTATPNMLPMTGTAWGLDVHHEGTCPNHEDNSPPNRRRWATGG